MQRSEFRSADKNQVANGVFAGADVGGVDFDEVDHAKVHAADVVAVVVEQGGDALAVAAGDFQFLVQLAFHGAEVGGFVEVLGVRVAVVDVSTDADGHLGVQAGFAAGFPARVAEDAVAVAQDEVGDELFVRRVLLGGAAGEEKVVGRVEEGGHVAVRLEAQALEGAEAVEDMAGDNQDVFFGGHGAEGSGAAIFGHPEKTEGAPACHACRVH